MDNPRRKLALLIRDFIKKTIVGHERGFFRAMHVDQAKEFLNGVKLTETNLHLENVIKLTTANYFNMVYDSLVTRDDPYVTDYFDRFRALVDHSPVCLINILFRYCTQIHTTLDRTLFLDRGKIEYLEDYSASVSLQFDLVFTEEHVAVLSTLVGHTCSGDRTVTPLPPG